MTRRRRLLLETLLFCWLSGTHGKRLPGRVRAFATTRGEWNDDSHPGKRGLTTIRGKKNKGMIGGERDEQDRDDTSVEVDEPLEEFSTDFETLGADLLSEQQATGKKSEPKSSKMRKKSRTIKENKSKLEAKRPGESSKDVSAIGPNSFDDTMKAAVKPDSIDEEGGSMRPEDSIDESKAPTETDPPSLAAPSPIPTIATTEPPTTAPSVGPNETSADDPSSPTESPTAATATPTEIPPLETPEPTQTPQFVAADQQTAAAYQFEEGGVTEPDTNEIFRLEIATSAFFIGVFADAYKDNPDTIFTTVVTEVDELIYDQNATPPIDIDWNFQVAFDSSSTVLPSPEEIQQIIYSSPLKEYVDVYLHNQDDVWSNVTSVTFYNSSSEMMVEEPDFPNTNVEASLMLDFEPKTVQAEPSQEEYERLVNALGVFYTALLTQTYTGVDDTTLATVTASLIEALFTEDDEEGEPSSLQANLAFDVFFSEDTTSVPTPDDMLDIMQENEASLLRFLQEDHTGAWQKDGAWHDVSSLEIEELTAVKRKGKGKGGGRHSWFRFDPAGKT